MEDRLGLGQNTCMFEVRSASIFDPICCSARLRDKWGIVDVKDIVACVNQMVKLDLVDEKRVVIRGGSAGKI
jgi:poly(3-hydroxybutyrate) depolymerase